LPAATAASVRARPKPLLAPVISQTRPLLLVMVSSLAGAEIANTEETVEALTAGLGVCLIAAGNTPLITPRRCRHPPRHGRRP
jgi:hypothetical protein